MKWKGLSEFAQEEQRPLENQGMRVSVQLAKGRRPNLKNKFCFLLCDDEFFAEIAEDEDASQGEARAKPPRPVSL